MAAGHRIARLQHLHDRLDLKHGGPQADGLTLVRQQLPRQLGMEKPQRVDGLL